MLGLLLLLLLLLLLEDRCCLIVCTRARSDKWYELKHATSCSIQGGPRTLRCGPTGASRVTAFACLLLNIRDKCLEVLAVGVSLCPIPAIFH